MLTEICNGYDDDCDGLIDVEDLIGIRVQGFVLYLDSDGDGSGDENQILQRCFFIDGYVLESGDCDDSNSL